MTLPPVFLTRLEQIIDAADLPAVLASFEHKRETTLRVNTLKTRPDVVEKWLKENKIEYREVKGMPLAFVLPGLTARDVSEWEFYQSGAIYLQNLSSQIPPLILQPVTGEAVLDLAAAPGSKTSQMAAMMELKGKLVANDRIYPRYKKLEANCRNLLGADQVKTHGFHANELLKASEFLELVNQPGELLGKNITNVFDKVLIDAPCSSEGQFCLAEPKSMKYWSRHKVKDMAGKQYSLLKAAINAAKVGATIVYSTCTFAPEENELVVNRILRKLPGVVEILPIGDPVSELKNTRSGLTEWNGKLLAPELAQTLRILPDAQFEGFYVAKLRKMTSLV